MAINNLKQIREIYGATQEQIARALSVNRVTVANWENGTSMASSANREKMSIYYGIGPEFFYENELTDTVKKMIQNTAAQERALVDRSGGKRNKQEDFHEMFDHITFGQVMEDYMMIMKMLLAKADDGDLNKLRSALTINEKMGRRLSLIIKLREDEEDEGVPSMASLIQEIKE